MINNIIFLDIDGVLNSDKYFSSIEDKEDTYTDPVAKLTFKSSPHIPC